MMSTITIDNIGPITNLEIPIPDAGLVVLRGGQGAGKSTALDVISEAMGGPKSKATPRDGQKRGTVEGCGVKLVLSPSRHTKRGELEVEEIQSRFDVSALVDPGLKDEDRADAARIKALIALSGVTADAKRYYDLVGGREEFNELGIDTDTDDPIVLAGRVKRALEAKARTIESQAGECIARAKAIREGFEESLLEAYSDVDTANSEYQKAQEEYRELRAKATAIDEQIDRYVTCVEQLKEAESQYDVPSFEDAQSAFNDASKVCAERKKAAEEAQKAYEESERKMRSFEESMKLAQSYESTVEGIRKVIAGGCPTAVTDREIEETAKHVSEAEAVLNTAREASRAKMDEENAAELTAKYKAKSKVASVYRDASKDVDGVLSCLLPESEIRIDGGRLVVATDRSPTEPYSELSEGERYELAIDLASRQLPERGCLIIPQVAFEGLTDSTRGRIQARLIERGVRCFTSEAVDGELKAEVYE